MTAGTDVGSGPDPAGAAPPERRPLARMVPSWVPPRARLWFLVGLAIAGVVILKDSSTLLGQVQNAGDRSYDAGAFSGFKLNFWAVGDLAEAIRIWAKVQLEGGLPVRRLIGWHLAVDALLFIPSYCILLHRLLKKVGATRPVYRHLVLALFVVDEIETVISWVVLVGFDLRLTDARALFAIQLFSFLKWIFLLAALSTAFFLWRAPEVEGEIQSKGMRRALAGARAGKAQAPAQALAGLIVLVAVFAGIIGLPAGGPLDQIPDVIRYQLGDHLGVWLLSSFGLFLFASALLVAGLLSTDPGHERVPGKPLPTLPVVIVALVFAGILELLVLAFQGRFSGIPFVFPGLVAVLWAVSKVVQFARKARKGASGGTSREDADDVAPEIEPMTEEDRAIWIGALVGVIVMAAGLGMLRAAYPPALLLTEQKEWWSWVVLGVIGRPSADGSPSRWWCSSAAAWPARLPVVSVESFWFCSDC